MEKKPRRILLVEDDPDDVELTKRAFSSGKSNTLLDVIDNGEDALKFLRMEKPFLNANRPDLVLLDLNLPRIDGYGILDAMNRDDNLKTIPVVVLSTSASEEDVRRSYNACVNCFITKPVGMESYRSIIQKLEEFWFQIARIPVST